MLNSDNLDPLYCSNYRKPGRLCNRYLGAVDKSVAHTAFHYCKDCKITWAHEVDSLGLVHRRKHSGRISTTAQPVRLDHGA